MTTTPQQAATPQHATLAKQFRAAQLKSVPLIGIETSDPSVTCDRIEAVLGDAPLVVWDTVRGYRHVNDAGKQALTHIAAELPLTPNVVEALVAAQKFPADTVVLMQNIHRFYGEPAVMQAIWNLRDQNKVNARMLVLLGPSLRLPSEIEGDVVVFEDARPTDTELADMLAEQYDSAQLGAPDDDTTAKAIDALSGLALFPAENATALSLTAKGVDLPALWHRKIQHISQSDGLRVERPTTTLSDLGGLAAIKAFATQISAARWHRVVWFIDEIEKDMAAMHTDTSGVSQYFLKLMLTFLQRHRVPALLLTGQPGTGKTEIARAIAGESKSLLVEMDLGAMKGSHVGESEQRANAAFQTLLRVSQGRLLLVATCNDVATLERSPELMRRFKLPKFYFDLPTADELDAIWPIAGARHGVDVAPSKRPAHTEGWTGAEIDACCELAHRLHVSVRDAAQWIVPMATAQRDVVERRRQAANGKALNASAPGVYQMGMAATERAVRSPRRAIAVEG